MENLDSANLSTGYYQLFSALARSKAVDNLHRRAAYSRLLKTGLLTFAILFKCGYNIHVIYCSLHKYLTNTLLWEF